MSTDREVQLSFLQWVKEKSNGEFQFVDELAYLLDISRDSAYRRLRGETLLTFNEIRKISQHYHASLDAFFNLSSNSILFQKRTLGKGNNYEDFLLSVLSSVKLIEKEKGHKMTYIAKDIPPFHYFQFKEISEFKSYFWIRTILKDPNYQEGIYQRDVLPQKIHDLSKEIWDNYVKIPSLEIWSDETINITLRQIEYYYESNILMEEQANHLLDELQKMVHHIKKEAELGYKFTDRYNQHDDLGRFELYYNEIEIGDNTVFFEMDSCMVLKTYNMLNFLTTTDNSFCNDIKNYIQNILQKSVPISSSSEKERIKFFNQMDQKIEKLRNKIS